MENAGNGTFARAPGRRVPPPAMAGDGGTNSHAALEAALLEAVGRTQSKQDVRERSVQRLQRAANVHAKKRTTSGGHRGCVRTL
jgi:hypothetical protein